MQKWAENEQKVYSFRQRMEISLYSKGEDIRGSSVEVY